MDETLNHAPCGFVSLNDQGRILEINSSLLNMLGFAPGELLGAKFETILTVASRIFYQTHLFPLLAMHGKAEEVFLTLQARGKAEIPMLVYAKRGTNANQCILVPVSERQKYEQEILAAKRAAEEALRSNQELLTTKSQLQAHARELDRRILRAEQINRELLQVTNILFHDLREPIRKIETFSGMLLDDSTLNEESRGSLSKIASACSRASLLLRALQQFVSVETADDQLEPAELDGLVQGAYQRIGGAYPDVRARFEMEGLSRVQGYPRQLRLLFEHLFDNAFRFRRPDHDLEIKVTASVLQENSFRTIQGRYHYIDFVQIYIDDNGIGIPPQYWDSAFELLKKMDLQNAQPGCGLAIARKVVENHYGSIAFSRKSSPGTAIKILLPVKQLPSGIDIP